MNWIRRHRKTLFPLGLVVLAVVVARILIATRPEVERTTPTPPGPLVRVTEVRLAGVRIDIPSQGTVEPRTEITLVAESPGRIVSAAPSFESGGFFEKGDVLVRVDARDYELAVIRARSQVAQAEVLLAREKAESELARKEWESLGEGEPSSLTLREPQLAEARAIVANAEAALTQAELDLERALIRAPFAGRVRKKLADVGQYVGKGAAVAVIYAVDYAEVRLPLPDDDLAYLDLPIGHRGERESAEGPAVTLTARVAGAEPVWRGRVVRVEGEIDPMSRMVHAVARVVDPYGAGAGDDPGRFPLAAGLFVQATIEGRTFDGVVRLPRPALRHGDRVYLYEEGRLRYREVSVLRAGRDEVFVDSGLAEGDLVILSPMDVAVDGMKVRIPGEGGEGSAAGAGGERP
ncbi:MAG: efflux RND transporter periplasmic adaptor subunit [Candidatus Eisenbacteria bacterium]